MSWILITVELKSNSVWNDLLKVGKPTQALIISCEPLHNLQRICLHSATKYVLAYKARQLMLDSTIVYMNFWTLHRWAWVSLQGQIVRFRNCMWKAFWQKVKIFGNKFSYTISLIPLTKSTSVLHSQLQAHIKASRLRVGKKNPWVSEEMLQTLFCTSAAGQVTYKVA